MEQMRKVSIIMPVYNAEKYLREAIESIVKQQNVEWELLLVDNGSKDLSLEICQQFARKYSRIRVLTEENPGAGNARNKGYQNADGDYILFVDADDYLPDAKVLERFVCAIESEDADIAVCNYQRLWKTRLLPATDHKEFSEKDRNTEDFRFQGFFSVGTLSYVWGKLYRRSFLEQNQIRFGNYEYAEDKMYNLECYIAGAEYTFVQECGYIYRKNDDSVSFRYKKDSWKCWLQIAHDLDDWTKKYKQDYRSKNLEAYILFFAAFFDAKMEYTEHQNSLKAVKQLLEHYAKEPLGKECFRMLAFGRSYSDISSSFWKLMMRGFSVGMTWHMFGLLSLGIKLLIDWRIDERLSDTGLRE